MRKFTYFLSLLLTALFLLPWSGVKAAQSLPYSYGFENNDLEGEGWTKYFATSLTKNNSECKIISDAKKTGSYGFRFSSYQTNGTNQQYLISPELNASTGVVVSFQYAASSTSTAGETFKVGYSTTGTNVSDFTFGDEQSTKSMSWSTFEHTFPSGTKYIAIYYYPTYQYRLYIDDVDFSVPATCPLPTITSAAASSVNAGVISWTKGNNESAWNVRYSEDETNWTTNSNVTATVDGNNVSYSLSGLSAGTKYYVQVQADCGGTDQSDWTASKSFKTDCNAMTITDFDGTFENETAGSGLMPNCWDAISTYEYTDYWSSTKTLYPCVKDAFSSAHNGDKSLAFYGGSNANPNLVVLPPFTEALNTVTVSFYYKNSSSYGGKFSFGYYKNGTFTAYEGASDLAISTSYTLFEKAIPNIAAAEGARLAILYSGASYNYEAFIDDITIIATPSCTKPSNVQVSNIVYNGATINWTENGSAEEWKVQYKKSSDTEWTTINNITEKPYVLTGLTPGSAYNVQVISVCGGTDGESQPVAAASTFTPTCQTPSGLKVDSKTTSTATISWTVNSGEAEWNVQYKTGTADWTTVTVTENPYTIEGLTSGSTYQVRVGATCNTSYTSAIEFDTECEAKSIPYEFDFSALTCWSQIDCNEYSGLNSGAYRFRWTTTPPQYLVSPELVASAKKVKVEFDYKIESSGNPETFAVGYSTTSNNVKGENVFTWGTEATYTNTSYETYSAILPEGVKYIAIKCTSNNKYYLYIDNFSVTEYEAPACAAPTALTFIEAGVDTAKVSWTSEATKFVLQDSVIGGAWTDVETNITSTSYILRNLTPNTLYYVRVKAVCGENPSSWVELDEPFRTDCEDKTVTEETAWNENFESGHEAGSKPACWSTLPNPATSGAYTQVNASAAKDGSLGLQVYAYGTNTEIAILPTFAVEIKNLKISFDYKNYGENSNYGALEVGYVSGTAFTSVQTLTKTTSFAASGVIEMPNDAPDGAHIALRVVGKKNNYNSSAYIDNISVIRKPACEMPTITAATATSTGAIITWTAGGEEEQWNIRYSVKDADTWTVLENKTSGFAITGLEVGTTYEVQVQAFCDELHQSAWSASAEFTPVCGAAPTALTVTSRGINTASLEWEGAESAFKLQISLDGENWESAIDVNAHNYDLEGLTAGTTYYVQVQNACGGEFASVSFKTWCDETLALPLNATSFDKVPDCWESTNEMTIASNKLCFTGEGEQFLYLPKTAINLDLLSVTLTFGGSLYLGYISEPNGAFDTIVKNVVSGTEYDLAELAPEATGYLAIRYNGASSLAQASISAIKIRRTPTCLKPLNLAADADVHSAVITWTAAGTNETAWALQYALKATTPSWIDAEGTIASGFELTNLAEGTTYMVRVHATCDEEEGDWADAIEFTTDCDVIAALPFTETFDAALSNCWKIYSENTSTYAAQVYNGALNLPGGKTGAGHVVVLPEITASLAKASLTITYSATVYKPEVGYVTDATDPSTFAPIEALNLSSSATTAYVALATVPANAHIALRYAGTGTSEGACAVEELRVSRVEVFYDDAANQDRFADLVSEAASINDLVLNRTLLMNGDYNTLCLPFSLSAEQLAESPLAGFKLKAFDMASVENEELLIAISDASSIEAGVPYFIAYQGNEANRATHIFHDVTIAASAPGDVTKDGVAYQGVFNPVDLLAQGELDDHDQLFLAAGNKIYWPAQDKTVKGFRAYFNVNLSETGPLQIKAGMPARIVERTGVATGCENINAADQAIKLLENNQVVIIRNGVKYSVQGQVISK